MVGGRTPGCLRDAIAVGRRRTGALCGVGGGGSGGGGGSRDGLLGRTAHSEPPKTTFTRYIPTRRGMAGAVVVVWVAGRRRLYRFSRGCSDDGPAPWRNFYTVLGGY